MKYTIQIKPRARKTLKKLPFEIQCLIAEKLEFVAEDPYRPNNNLKRL